jgi:hypothetical protein
MRTLLVGAFAILGCSAGEEAMFSVTEVHLDGDKSQVVATEMLTREQMFDRSSLTARRSAGEGISVSEQAISNVACSGSTVRLQDRDITSCNQFGCNQICFSGAGTASLLDYCYGGMFCPSKWAYHVKAYYPGGNTGHLNEEDPDGGQHCINFSGTTGVNNAYDLTWYLTIGSSC